MANLKANQHDLIIMVDATGSMAAFLDALRQALPQIIAVSDLTQCFSRTAVLAYRDYNVLTYAHYRRQEEVISWSGWHEQGTSGDALLSMAADVWPGGGGGEEALKTGLARAYAEMRDDAETLILLYADAPPHLHGHTDDDARLERDQLRGTPFNRWDLACHALAKKRAKVISITDCQTYRYNPSTFIYLSTITNGMCIQTNDRAVHAISQLSIDILLRWMGAADEETPEGSLNAYGSILAYPNLVDIERQIRTYDKWLYHAEDFFTTDAMSRKYESWQTWKQSDFLPPKQPRIADFSQRYKSDSEYRAFVAEQLQTIIQRDIVAMSRNAVFGSLWRAVCSDRDSPAREGLLSSFSVAVDHINLPDEKVRMKTWLEESYDYTSEVLALIDEVPEAEQFPCVFLDPTENFTLGEADADASVQDITSFRRDELLDIGRSCDRSILRKLGRCLRQLSFVERKEDLARHIASSDLKDVPRIPLALASASHKSKFWKILLHLVVPGTMLSSRPAALLAALALRVGIKPLEQAAVSEVMIWRDRWTKSLDYPETWSLGCLTLLLDADKANKQSLTNAGASASNASLLLPIDKLIFEKLVAYKLLELNLDTNLTAQIGWQPQKSSLPVAQSVRCVVCGQSRSVTIMSANSICGLCVPVMGPESDKRDANAVFTSIEDESDSMDIDDIERQSSSAEATEARAVGGPQDSIAGTTVPAQTEAAWVECSAQECRAQYVVYRPGLLNVRPKCFYCREKGQIPKSQWRSAPTLDCTKCLNRVIFPEEYRSNDMDLATFKCIGCEIGRKTVIPVELTARQIEAENGRSWLLREQGDLDVSFGTNRSLFHAVSTLGLKNVASLEVLPSEKTGVLTLRSKPLHNTSDVLDQLSKWVVDCQVEQGTCSLCFSDVHKSQLVDACGRRGCHQQVDKSCLTSWYGVNKPGSVINVAALNCAFCRRPPAAKKLAQYGFGIHAVKDLQKAVDQSGQWIYAWCADCATAKPYVERVCAAGAPELQNWRCDECEESRGRDIKKVLDCPGCGQPTEKVSGCNHICCTICSTHWCFICGEKRGTDTIYEHMDTEHGSFFDAGEIEGDEYGDYNDEYF